MKQQVYIVISFLLLFLQSSYSFGANPSNKVSGANAPQKLSRIIIKYRANSSLTTNTVASSIKLNNIVNVNGATIHHHHNISGDAQVWELDQAVPVAEAKALADEIALDPAVEYAEPDIILSHAMTPNDTRYNEQWHYFENTAGLNLPLAWDKATGKGVVVAVLDTGYLAHRDLAANILPGYDMVSDQLKSNDGSTATGTPATNYRDSDATDPGDAGTVTECGNSNYLTSTWHGTHVAGTVAAISNNNIGVAGVAFDAKILPVRVLGKCGGTVSDLADGILWAAGIAVTGVPNNKTPAKVLNLSLTGAYNTCPQTLQNAITQATQKGVTIVVAAGNNNADASTETPPNCNGVMNVAAVTRAGGRASYSNFGTAVTIAAPGGSTSLRLNDGVLSTLNTGTTTAVNDSYMFYQGTSMATPHIAGLVALLYSAKPSLTSAQAVSAITSSARTFPATCTGCGAGIADALAAVNLVLKGGAGNANGSILKNNVAVNNISGAKNSETFYSIDIPAGATNLSFKMTGAVGDADLYVKFGSKPTISVFDYRPYLDGSNETINIGAVKAGTYHIMIQGYLDFSAVSLVASY